MIALKPIFHPSFYPSSNNTTIFTTLHPHHITRIRSSVFLCLSTTNNSNDKSDNNSKPEGDVKSQELLAQLAMLETEKLRLTDYLDERSEYLTQFGEEAKAELDKIGEDALKGLDESSDRVCMHFPLFTCSILLKPYMYRFKLQSYSFYIPILIFYKIRWC
jgi:hypothetical protein